MSVAASKLVSPAMKWAVGGWSFFILENLVLSENRTYIINELGDDGYHMAYGTLSTCAMASVFYGYFRKVRDTAPLLWKIGGPVPLPAKIGSFICLSVGLGMASQVPPKFQIPLHYGEAKSIPDVSSTDTAMPQPEQSTGSGWKVRCPFDFTDKPKDAQSSCDVHGLERISRHPGLWSFGLLGLGTAFLVPSLPQRAWLMMPAMVALIGGSHTDSRHRRGMGGELSLEYDKLTSNVPFLAIISGAQGNVYDVGKKMVDDGELKVLNAAIAVGAAGVFVLSKGRGRKPRF